MSIGAELHASGTVDLAAAMHEHTVALRQAVALERWKIDQGPRLVEPSASGIVPASGNLLLLPNPGGPAPGRLWHVREVAATLTAAATTTKAGVTIYSYVGMPGSAALADVPSNWKDRTTTNLPVPAFYGDWEFALRFPDQLYFLVVGGTAAEGYTVNVTARDEPDLGTVGSEAVVQTLGF